MEASACGAGLRFMCCITAYHPTSHTINMVLKKLIINLPPCLKRQEAAGILVLQLAPASMEQALLVSVLNLQYTPGNPQVG